MKKGQIWLLVVVLIFAYLVLPGFIARSLYPLKYEDKIIDYSNEQNIDPSLIAALVYNESRFDPEATSSKKAYGLMQVQPLTAQEVLNRTVEQGELRDPDFNLRVGVKYFKMLRDRYDTVEKALIAYNLGPTNLDKQLKITKSLEELGSAYGFARHVLKDQKIYGIIYPQLTTDQELEGKATSYWQLWKIIFTGRAE